MDGCNVLPETQFVGTCLRVDTTRVLSVGCSLPPWGAAGERQEPNIKPPLGAPLLIFPRGYLLRSFPQVDTSARQREFEIRAFPLLGELPKAIEPHLQVCHLYRWQLGPNMWSSPTTKSLDPIVVTALRVGFPWENHGPATCGFAFNCPEPEAWPTQASAVIIATSATTHYTLTLSAIIVSSTTTYILAPTANIATSATTHYTLTPTAIIATSDDDDITTTTNTSATAINTTTICVTTTTETTIIVNVVTTVTAASNTTTSTNTTTATFSLLILSLLVNDFCDVNNTFKYVCFLSLTLKIKDLIVVVIVLFI